MSSSTTEKFSAVAPGFGDLRSAIDRDLRAPIAALRATLEDLGRELGGFSSAGTLVRGALEQLIAVDQRTEALVELLMPGPLRPLSCSLGEIARNAWSSLPTAHRGRVWLAIEDAEHSLVVDGPVLVRSLAFLLEDAAEQSGQEVLLHAHCDQGVRLNFGIVGGLEGPAASPHAGISPRVESLPARLARRDIERLGGELVQSEPSDPQRLTLVHLPALGGRA